MIATWGLLFAAAPARAGLFEARSSRDELPAREVERPVVLARGWLDVGIAYEHTWLVDGRHASLLKDGEVAATARYGFCRRVELWATVPVHDASIVDAISSVDQLGWGDPAFGVRLGLVDHGATRRTSVAVDAGYKAPMGQESPVGVVLTTGTPDASLGLAAKQQVGALAAVAHATYALRFPGVAQYAADLRADPGDLASGDLVLGLQVGPFYLSGGARGEAWSAARLGRDLEAVAGSEGASAQLTAAFRFDVSRGLDVVIDAGWPIVEDDASLWPIVPLEPAFGETWGATVEARY